MRGPAPEAVFYGVATCPWATTCARAASAWCIPYCTRSHTNPKVDRQMDLSARCLSMKQVKYVLPEFFLTIMTGAVVGVVVWFLTQSDIIDAILAWQIALVTFSIAAAALVFWSILGPYAVEEMEARRDLRNARLAMRSLRRVISNSHLPEVPKAILAVLIRRASTLDDNDFNLLLALNEYESKRRYFRRYEDLATRQPNQKFWKTEQWRMLKALLEEVEQNFRSPARDPKSP